ncbi:MAG: phage tail protein [Anaerotignum propionicum]|uniref:phage tail protein n=1 Tax=Anaerotignum propionicum TaxID=28446 RepID=UPI002B1F4E44|nr:phage tail protein [Anaerotignum propionicum]MEA5057779.1 phage tail protein [Anaerotignum propionicum]
MAIIGAWGDIVFEVSRKQVKTFNGLNWDGGAKFATHDRHLKEPILEFTGTENENMTFSMFFSAFLGVNPIIEVEKLFAAMRKGEVNRLIIGTKAYGTDKWVITKLSNALERYDNRGNLLVVKVNVTMKSYASR